MPDNLHAEFSDVLHQNEGPDTSLLAQKITDLQLVSTVLNDTVDREMGVYRTHLVLEALESHSIEHCAIKGCSSIIAYLRYTGDHVRNQGFQRAQDSNVLPAALPDGEGDLVDLALYQPDVDIGVSDILRQGTARACYFDETRFHSDLDSLGDFKFFGLEDVSHLFENNRLGLNCTDRIQLLEVPSSLVDVLERLLSTQTLQQRHSTILSNGNQHSRLLGSLEGGRGGVGGCDELVQAAVIRGECRIGRKRLGKSLGHRVFSGNTNRSSNRDVLPDRAPAVVFSSLTTDHHHLSEEHSIPPPSVFPSRGAVRAWR